MSAAEKEKTGIHTGADLRAKTVETFLANPKLATELFQTADRLSYIKPDALKIGGNRYRINVGTTKDPSSSSHYRSQYVNDDGGKEIDYLEVGSYDKDGNFQLKKCEVIERGPGGIYLVRFAESDKSTIGVLLAPGDDVSKDIQGYGLEPGGPSTAEANQNKRIPAGQFNVMYNDGDKYPKTTPKIYREEKDAQGNPLPDDVPKDRGILIHQGNSREDTQGCIIVGDTFIENGEVKCKDGSDVIDYKVSGAGKTEITETGDKVFTGPSTLKLEEIKTFLKEKGYENVKVHILDHLPAGEDQPDK